MVARDSFSLGGTSLAATSAIIGVLVEEGGIEAADRRYRDLLPQLRSEDRERLALRLAQGWIRNGRLGRADSLIAADSSVEAFAVRGRIALYRGDLNGARGLLREAGPFAGDRASATQRIGVLGLLQVIDGDSLPGLGEALFRLERGDSSASVQMLEKVAEGLSPQRGGAELLLLAGQVQAGAKRNPEAERIFRAVIAQNVPASSAAAEFALAGLLLKQGKKPQAIAALEHLLLTWPTSAVVPQARRLLDVAKGAVPAS
jgi:tetratricopeptide (TPR) repeat protein